MIVDQLVEQVERLRQNTPTKTHATAALALLNEVLLAGVSLHSICKAFDILIEMEKAKPINTKEILKQLAEARKGIGILTKEQDR